MSWGVTTVTILSGSSNGYPDMRAGHAKTPEVEGSGVFVPLGLLGGSLRRVSTSDWSIASPDRAQVEADAERAILRNQEPPARFSAPIARKNAAHP